MNMNQNKDEVWTRYYDPEEEAEKIRVTYESIGLKRGLERGKKQGIEQGKKQGQEEERKKIIQNMSKNNMKASQIATIMNLKQQEVYRYLQM